jgi:hypothetical protein
VKSKKTILILIAAALLILGVGALFKYGNSQVEVPDIHYHAGFVVFENGQKVDFSDNLYMNIEPCKVHDANEKETPEHIQTEKAHLHDNVGDVVHTHVAGARWRDLFTNIKYPLDYEKVTAYVNGQRVAKFEDLPIVAYNSLVIFVGSTDETLLSQGVTEDRIKEVEAKSELCGSDG